MNVRKDPGGNLKRSSAVAITCGLLVALFAIDASVASVPEASAANGVTATAVTSGGVHTCALLTNVNVDCWGNNYWGQADDYTTGDATAISAGDFHTCVLLTDGNVHCSGRDLFGQADDYTTGDATAISAGGLHTCALLTSGNVDCWGYNYYGQADDYTGGDAAAIAAGYFHTCALLTTGSIHCWGYPYPDGPDEDTGGNTTDIASGLAHVCALLTNGNVDCWGGNGYGEADDYTGGDASAISAGDYYTCALLTNGNVHCWGRNSYGQSNDYTGGDAAAISSGMNHACALLNNGIVHCWGRNNHGQAVDQPGPPDAPTSLEGSPTSVGEITLTWNAPNGATWANGVITTYHIYRADSSGGSYTQIGSVGDSVLTYEDAGLADGATYHYRVMAVSSAGEGPASNTANVMTWADPSAPQRLTAVLSVDPEGISLSWDAPASDGGTLVIEYHVYRADTNGGPYTSIGRSTTTTYTDTGCPQPTACSYVVHAVNAVGEGPASNAASVLGTLLDGLP